jgi:hypothetical protein
MNKLPLFGPSSHDEVEIIVQKVGNMGQSLLSESERASVILAAAHLDAALEDLLRRLLVPHPGGVDPMFDGDRMLGTFSAKIGFAFRLGAIDAEFEHAIQIVRRIRNDFAHQLDQETLSTERQRARLLLLTRWADNTILHQQLKISPNPSGKSKEQLQFVACIVCMAVLLNIGCKKFRQLALQEPLSISDLQQKTA